MKRYTVINVYGIQGETTHRKVGAAIKARDKREGDGWVVVDDEGNRYDMSGDRVIMDQMV